MDVLSEVNEGSTSWLVASFYGKDGNPETPDAVVYEIWDIPSGTQIKSETSLTPGPDVEITLSSTDNKILNSELFREARRVIVTATYSGSQKLVSEFVYHVKNIAHKTT